MPSVISKASKNYSYGDVIAEYKPFVYVLDKIYREKFCNLCLNDGSTKHCSRCKQVYYCSVQCQ